MQVNNFINIFSISDLKLRKREKRHIMRCERYTHTHTHTFTNTLTLTETDTQKQTQIYTACVAVHKFYFSGTDNSGNLKMRYNCFI